MSAGDGGPFGLFSSRRERRLWLWVGLVLITIYSTLGVAPSLTGWLRSEGVLGVSFSVGMLLVGGAIVAMGLRARVGSAEVGVGLGLAAIYLLVFVRLALPPEERTHLIEYGVLAILIFEALAERRRNDRRILATAAFALAITVLLGWIDEGIQWLLPNRVYDIQDVLFNALAALMAISARLALAQARQWWGRQAGQSTREDA